ncbi:MAG TPA: DUF302 domain-containing protein [Longimicrobiales bacterium]|nr:DUF302 domain-containing protein [Longimicrobiales bacterium]
MTIEDTKYGMKRIVDLPLDEADARMRAELKDQGFGILTEIDLSGTLREKIGADVRPYRILGACNPPIAHQAVTEELDIGLLLPCNVVVYQGDDEETSVVGVLDPVVQLGVTGRDDITALAEDVRGRMRKALAAI